LVLRDRRSGQALLGLLRDPYRNCVMVDLRDSDMAELGQHVSIENGPVPSPSYLPMAAEGGEPGFGEFGHGLLRSAVVDPIAAGEISLDRCTELDRVCLLFKGLRRSLRSLTECARRGSQLAMASGGGGTSRQRGLRIAASSFER